MYDNCGRGCFPTCQDPNPSDCLDTCVEGCYCPPGMYLRSSSTIHEQNPVLSGKSEYRIAQNQGTIEELETIIITSQERCFKTANVSSPPTVNASTRDR